MLIALLAACTLDTSSTSSAETVDTVEMIGDASPNTTSGCTPTLAWDTSDDHIDGFDTLEMPSLFVDSPCPGAITQVQISVMDMTGVDENGIWLGSLDEHLAVNSDIDPVSVSIGVEGTNPEIERIEWDIVANVPVVSERTFSFRWAAPRDENVAEVEVLWDNDPEAISFGATLVWNDVSGTTEISASQIITVFAPTE